MGKVLVIVHVEPVFNIQASNGHRSSRDIEELAQDIYDYSKNYGKVLNVVSERELCQLPKEINSYPILNEFKKVDFVWGFDPEDSDVECEDYIRTSGHEYSKIYPWMRDLDGSDSYYLVGGARNECLQDIYDLFNHMELDVHIIEKYTY